MSVMVRVSERFREELHDIAAREQVSMQDILARALEAYKRQQFFECLDAGYAALRADPTGQAEYETELEELEGTLGDGLAHEGAVVIENQPSLR